MLKISQGMFDAISTERRQRTVDAITDWLMAEFPGEPDTRQQIREQVLAIAQVAWGWGIEEGSLVATHVYASKVLGTDYYVAFPPAGQVLSDRELGDDMKEAWLCAWLDTVKEHMDKTGRSL